MNLPNDVFDLIGVRTHFGQTMCDFRNFAQIKAVQLFIHLPAKTARNFQAV